MIKSESYQDLVNAPDHFMPSKVEEFIVPDIGGGFIVVNMYGEYVVSIGRIDFGTIGETWSDTEVALESLRKTANTTSDKCAASDIKIGGCGICLYFIEPGLDTPSNRRTLLNKLSKVLPTFIHTNIVTVAGHNTTTTDLLTLAKDNEAFRSIYENSESDDEKKVDEDLAAKRARTTSFQLATAGLEFPVPTEMIDPDNLRDNTVFKAAAQSAFGAISTLAKSKQWAIPKIVLMGASQTAIQLYWTLTKENYDVFVSDSDPEAFNGSKISKKSVIPWSKAISFKCDILALCSADYPVFDEATIDSLNTRAIVSISDNLLLEEEEDRERAYLACERKGIFEFMDGMCDLGWLAKTFSMANASFTFSMKDAVALGEKVMKKKLHLDKIVTQYDTDDKRKFYNLVLADHVDDIGGLKLGLGTILHNSTDSMTQWMWAKARTLCPAMRSRQKGAKDKRMIRYIDLGAGNGSAARWICSQDPQIHVKCVNICPKQNAENRQLSDEQGLGGQVSVETCTFERLPTEWCCVFDGCISQDSFIHAFNKRHALSEAFRITKGGGWLMVSDLMCGDDADVSAEELKSFAQKNNVTNWVTPSQYVALATETGWAEAQFIDCTAQIKVSLQNLLKKIKSLIETQKHKGLNLKLLQTHRLSLGNRMGQIDRGVFKWGIIAARKPYDVVFITIPPVVPKEKSMITYSTNNVDGILNFGTDVVVLNIKDKMPRDKIMQLPSTVRLIVTMSAGLDHIDMDAAKEKGLQVRRAARFQIVKSVADYLLSNIIFGLRNGFQNIGVPFPGKSWDLSWNADGVDLDRSKIGFIGMGAIAAETARRIRALSDECELVYHIPDGIRSRFEEGTYRMKHIGIADLYSTCDAVIPMVPLTKATTNLVDYRAFTMMKNTAIFINMARGKVVDTEGMTKALKDGLVRHAILDTTEPEPLPANHELWGLKNCSISPHFATNTTYVREELVEDIPNEIEDTLDERGILRLEEQRMRKELSDAYRITREFGMDELVWNHLSVLLSDSSYLITPGSNMFDDIGPQDLVKSGGSGNVTADIIHDAVYKVRPDVKAIVHLHTPATVAVSCLEMGFVPLAQEAAPFVGRVASYPWHGVSNDWDEQEMIGEKVKDTSINTLVMENHGFCTFGKTLGEAWVLAYYFDKSCQTQLNCLQSGAKIRIPDPKVLAHAAQQAMLPEFLPGACEWDALRKMLTRKSNR